MRWCLGRLHSTSPSVDTLAEAGELPISYVAVRARITYYLLVKSRPPRHITTAALAEAITATQKQDNWINMVQADMKRWEITETDSSRLPTKGKGKEARQAIAGRTKVACNT